MRVSVRELRARGVRRPEREVGADPGTAGELALSSVAGYMVLTLHETTDTHMTPLIPLLYDAKCVSIHGPRMLWRGFQKSGEAEDKSAPTYMQEWTITVV